MLTCQIHTLRYRGAQRRETQERSAAGGLNSSDAGCRHEGFGSPFAVLKARGWATELSAGEGGSSFSARSFFTVGINLTDEGKLRALHVPCPTK